METDIKLEPVDVDKVEIKEEKELLIEGESQWAPVKYEDNYYQHFKEESSSQNVIPVQLTKNEYYYEQYTISYLNENTDYSDDEYENADYPENEDAETSAKSDSDESDNNLDIDNYGKNRLGELEKQENVCKEEQPNKKVLCKQEFYKWLNNKYIHRRCPVCHDMTKNSCEWRNHILLNHREEIEKSDSNYNFKADVGICKICHLEYVCQFSRYVHSVKHASSDANLFMCQLCSLDSHSLYVLQKHFVDKHPQVVKEFEIEGCFLKCPLCPNIYKQKKLFSYHFMDKHRQEYNSKFTYKCHLCKHKIFTEEDAFLQHLIEKHELNSWDKLNYRRLFEDKEYISCIKCNILFSKTETTDFLKHYLKHENDCYWKCKFCSRRIYFNKPSVHHLCSKMIRFYERHPNEFEPVNIAEKPKESEPNIKNLQEFENYIAHVCPFCNTEFDKMLKWQHHLKTAHKIDTLKGLKMKVTANDSSKLICVICYTMVPNFPEQLHAHRFQHLPYEPYKCLMCSVTLKTFKIACNHVLKRCNDEEDRDHIKNIIVQNMNNNIRSLIEIQCTFCDSEKFSSIAAVIDHYEDEHNYFDEFLTKNPDNSRTCKICNKKYVQFEKKHCFRHLQSHFDEKAFKCPICFYTYSASKSCYHHLISLHYVKPLNDQPKQENGRTTTFLLDEEYKVSEITLLPQLGKPTPKSYVLNEFAEYITYACPECNEGMTSQQNWHIHVTTQHNFFKESNLYIQNDDGSCKCPTCNIRIASSTTQQQKHKLTHMPYRSFICNLCYSRCNSLGVLYGHFRRVHFAQGTFECPVCLEVLQTSHQRTEHLKKTHPRDEWPDNMCSICYKILSKNTNLKMHMLTHDANRFKYTCDICGSKLVELKDFKVHMARHKSRGEVKLTEETADDEPSQSGSKSIESNNAHKFFEADYNEKLNKRKSLTESINLKKKKD